MTTLFQVLSQFSGPPMQRALSYLVFGSVWQRGSYRGPALLPGERTGPPPVVPAAWKGWTQAPMKEEQHATVARSIPACMYMSHIIPCTCHVLHMYMSHHTCTCQMSHMYIMCHTCTCHISYHGTCFTCHMSYHTCTCQMSYPCIVTHVTTHVIHVYTCLLNKWLCCGGAGLVDRGGFPYYFHHQLNPLGTAECTPRAVQWEHTSHEPKGHPHLLLLWRYHIHHWSLP